MGTCSLLLSTTLDTLQQLLLMFLTNKEQWAKMVKFGMSWSVQVAWHRKKDSKVDILSTSHSSHKIQYIPADLRCLTYRVNSVDTNFGASLTPKSGVFPFLIQRERAISSASEQKSCAREIKMRGKHLLRKTNLPVYIQDNLLFFCYIPVLEEKQLP